MIMDKIYANVYITSEYSKFKFLEENREVKKRRVKRIKESIDGIGLILQPILVNEKYEIIDGQGRFNACVEMGLPILYVMQEGLGVDECRWLNVGQENWGLWDWINSYADGGNVDYQRFRTFVNATDFPLTYIEPLPFGECCYRPQNNKDIKDGHLKFTKQIADRIKWEVDYLTAFMPVKKKIKGRSDCFYGALVYAYRNLNTNQRNRLLDVVKKNTIFMDAHATMEGNLKMFDELYNKGLRKDSQIHLELSYRTENI